MDIYVHYPKGFLESAFILRLIMIAPLVSLLSQKGFIDGVGNNGRRCRGLTLNQHFLTFQTRQHSVGVLAVHVL